MSPFEIIGELCTMDSAFLRGWRWLISARYRQQVRIWTAEHHPIVVIAGFGETIMMMVVEVVALVFLIRWLLGL